MTLPARLARGIAIVLLAATTIMAEGRAGSIAEAAERHFDPQSGYRISRYRAPVPERVEGAQSIIADDVDGIVAEHGALLIDVMPSDGAGLDRHTGEWRMMKPHLNIPGSHWLPDVGFGEADPLLQRYLEDSLADLTGGNKAHPLIIYCQADCWMSWNAVRRVHALGYQNLYWLPEGTDGWRDWDLPLVPATPRPVATGSQNAKPGP